MKQAVLTTTGPPLRLALAVLLLCVGTLVVANPAWAEGYKTKVEASSPTAYYRLDETSGATAVDRSGLFNHGTYNAVRFGQVGATPDSNHAVKFNGTTSRVEIGRLVQDSFAIELWVKTTDSGGSVGQQWYNGKPLVDAELCGVTNDFGVSVLGGKAAFGIGNPDTTIASTTTINDNRWHHVVAMRGKGSTSSTLTLYVDGNLEATGASPNVGSLTASSKLLFGNSQCMYGFAGLLDEIALYGGTITSATVADHYGAGSASKQWAKGQACSDPWISQAIADAIGVTDFAKGRLCDPYLYNDGHWTSQSELTGYVSEALSYCGSSGGSPPGNPSAQQQRWITAALLEVTGRAPWESIWVTLTSGKTKLIRLQERCNRNLYDHGAFGPYSELKTLVAERNSRQAACSNTAITNASRMLIGWSPLRNEDVQNEELRRQQDECNADRYRGGDWSGSTELQLRLIQSYRCQDPWINQVIWDTTSPSRQARGNYRWGECNIYLYGGGNWSSYNDLKNKAAATLDSLHDAGRYIDALGNTMAHRGTETLTDDKVTASANKYNIQLNQPDGDPLGRYSNGYGVSTWGAENIPGTTITPKQQFNSLIGHAGGTVIATGGGNIIGHAGGTYTTTAGSNVIATGGLN